MANEKYFLQMSECQWPDHVFISRKKTFKICIYHKDAKKQHPSLYCVTNDEEAYPISIELLNSKKKVIRESKSHSNCHGRYKKLWTIISASTDFKIKHSYCEFAIQFDSLPPYYDQPLRFRFKATSNNPTIPMIEPFTTRPFRVVRYQLRISSGPPSTFYKDDGGMRNNHMTVKVQLLNPLKNGSNARKHKMSVPLNCKLVTEDGKEITGTMKKKGHHADDKQKSRPPLHYLQLHEDCLSPKISSVTGECIVKFRINDVSQNHKNQGFHVVIQPNIQKLPHLCEIYECRSSKIIVKSKSPEKLNSQGTSKKRRSTRSHSSHHNSHDHSMKNRKSGRSHKKRKKNKLKRKHNHNADGDDDDEYKPEDTDNSDIDMMNHKVKMESADAIDHLRKRRKLNGSQYVCTNGTGMQSINPKTFNAPPNHHWFPSAAENTQSSKHNKDKTCKSNENGPESEIQLFAQNCFEMLQFREWICIGYQTEYIDDDDDKLQIVRCLLCDAEGIWTSIKPPRHKKECDFVKLKRSYHQMQLGVIPTSTYPNPMDISPSNDRHHNLSHLPPLPQSQSKHNQFIPPAFPPPFFGPIPPIFPAHSMAPYHHILHQTQPPPLIQASSSNATDTKIMGNKTKQMNANTDKIKNGKHKIKSQTTDKQHDEGNKSSPLMFPFGHQSPQMYPTSVGPMQSPLFSINNVPQTPQMFSQGPLSANGPNNNNGPNMFTLPPGPNPTNSSLQNNHHLSINTHSLPSFGHTASTLPMPLQLPISSIMSPNTNHNHNESNNRNPKPMSSSDTKNIKKIQKLSKASSAPNDKSRSPTPQSRAQSLNPPVSTITAMSGITDNNNKSSQSSPKHLVLDHMPSFHSSRASSICNTAVATMGSPTATIRSNPPQKASHNTNTHSVDSAMSQSESLSAVATAGGLTINTPLDMSNNHKQQKSSGSENEEKKHTENNESNDNNNDNGNNKNTSQMILAHAPPLLPQYIISPHAPHILHQNSSNNSIETQIGSMPPLHPDTNSSSPTTSDKPLHQRRLMENAPTTLTIPAVSSLH